MEDTCLVFVYLSSCTISPSSSKLSSCSIASQGARIVSSSSSGAPAQYVLQTTNSGNNESQGSGRVIIATTHTAPSQSLISTTTIKTQNTNGQGQVPYVVENSGQFVQQSQTSTASNGGPTPPNQQVDTSIDFHLDEPCYMYQDHNGHTVATASSDIGENSSYEPQYLSESIRQQINSVQQPQQQHKDGPAYFTVKSSSSDDAFNHSVLQCAPGYFIPTGLDQGSQPLTHTTRASPATVQWLVDNFEPAEGCSLRRSTLYSFYLQHCSEQKLEPVNPASFGKLIRSVFLGLRTRRLGTRGNSKYHYYGIRVKSTSTLNQFSDEHGELIFRGQHHFPTIKKRRSTSHDTSLSPPENKPTICSTQNRSYSSHTSSILCESEIKADQQQQYTSETSGTNIFESIQINLSTILTTGVTHDDLKRFEDLYKGHCLKLFDVITNLQFTSVEPIWLNFWQSSLASSQSDVQNSNPFSNIQFHNLCSMVQVQDFIRLCDYQLYQQLVKRLITDILSPMPGPITQSIRNFGKGLDSSLQTAIAHMPERLKMIKLTIVNIFATTLRRYTSLNHLAQAARAVLNNASQVQQMLQDLNKVDFRNVQEQASWVCECDDVVVQRLEIEFKQQLQSQVTLEGWAQWLDTVVTNILKPCHNSPTTTHDSQTYIKMAKQFLLNCSMVIRDLTLRSAASFGSFHLIRLLYDEYMFYLIEHKIAEYMEKTPIEIMAESVLQSKLNIHDDVGQSSSAQIVQTNSAPFSTTANSTTGSNGIESTINIERRNIMAHKVALVVKKTPQIDGNNSTGTMSGGQNQAKIATSVFKGTPSVQVLSLNALSTTDESNTTGGSTIILNSLLKPSFVTTPVLQRPILIEGENKGQELQLITKRLKSEHERPETVTVVER
ncbi:unnamed protein product [Didymodactylos carnosus]|uniref:RFX-type winged-helix domain-containing protein n=1 Tax=Didymodactylos carnosus TaxID=1234261 RepID=A0A8S2E6H7_9BILA|nr:unnamed protein product [Didymodactylos carnosus]CAF3827707.1 unnamed protein product [Didymodactylos carnosus]